MTIWPPSFNLPAQWKFFASGDWDFYQDWHLNVELIATKTQSDFTFYDARAQQLMINGQPQYLPDGRIRYDGLGAVAGKTSNNGAAATSGNDLIEASSSDGYAYTAAFTVSMISRPRAGWRRFHTSSPRTRPTSSTTTFASSRI
jgi:hypothetical protein